MGSFFTFIGNWFGYVGSCVIAPDATCRPFLAFILMGAAASAALALIIMAYRTSQASQAREAAQTEERGDEQRAVERQERVRRAVAAHVQTSKAPLPRGYRPAV